MVSAAGINRPGGVGIYRPVWRCNDYAGYKALFERGVTEVGCLAHARRKFHDLWVNHKSAVAQEALTFFGALYDIECVASELEVDQRRRLRELKSRPLADTLHQWLLLQQNSDRWDGDRQGDRLQPRTMACVDALHR